MLLLAALVSLLFSNTSDKNPKKLNKKEKQRLERMAWELSDEYDEEDRF